MFDFDIFPEDGYDPSSGEYSADYDWVPVPLQDVELIQSGEVYAKIFSFSDDPTEGQRIIAELENYVFQGVFEPDYNPKNPRDYPHVPFSLDTTDRHSVRGPYLREQVARFFEDTGLEEFSDVYYDDDLDAFWIDVDTSGT